MQYQKNEPTPSPFLLGEIQGISVYQRISSKKSRDILATRRFKHNHCQDHLLLSVFSLTILSLAVLQGSLLIEDISMPIRIHLHSQNDLLDSQTRSQLLSTIQQKTGHISVLIWLKIFLSSLQTIIVVMSMVPSLSLDRYLMVMSRFSDSVCSGVVHLIVSKNISRVI